VRFTQDSLKLLLHRRSHEKIDEERIELLGPALKDRLSRFGKTSSRAVPSAVSDRIEGVSNADNPRGQRNSIPF
jgi:hypothetical protein